MSNNSRPKRRVAAKVEKIIEIFSDSNEEDESYEPSPKKTRRRIVKPKDHEIKDKKEKPKLSKAKKTSIKNTKKRPDDESEREQDPTSSPFQNKKARRSKSNERNGEIYNEHQNASCLSADNQNMLSETLNSSISRNPSKRNSFWGRRKVWTIPELLAETENIETRAASNIVQLLENENTIPFICRYRRDLVDDISPERLRDIKSTYTEIVDLRKKAENIVHQLEKENIINEDIRAEILCAKSAEELEFLHAPYKPASKGSLAERAKALGLEVYADNILYGEEPSVELERIVDYDNPDLDTVEKVKNGILNIMSHNISKHPEVLDELRRLQKVHRIMLTSSKSSSAKKDESEKNADKNILKCSNYFNFQNDIRYLKPHQILAINRGEKQKILTVKIVIPDQMKADLKRYVWNIFMSEGEHYKLRATMFEKVFDDCFSKKLQPLLKRQIRAKLNETAKKAAIDVFAKNLKQLLLMSPLKGEPILGIDPGFKNGCKLALISETADVLETGVIYPHERYADARDCGMQLAEILNRHSCKMIALGNGTACRETEFWLTKLFELNILDGNSVRYCIVSEQGASIYSCSEIAKKEFPNMDVNQVSAVSIARRLNDPLSEYVKIEPRHIGVGMYQHDINEKALSESLYEIVSECVSYVGVDINTASLSVLRHVAGLSEKKAEKIIKYRQENGVFRTRKDLLKVKTIGEKTFVQSAGFIRIEPRSVGGKVQILLDCTWVHPESYGVAEKIIKKCNLSLENIGTPSFIKEINHFASKSNINDLAKDFKIPKERLEIVFVALQRELFKDYRADVGKRPLFKQGVSRLTDLSVGDVVTGAVTNITDFGAFVDIGVERDALLHSSKMKNAALSIGDRITASILKVDIERKYINLRLEDTLIETDSSFTFKSCVD